MQIKINKSSSRILAIWIFFLLLIHKSIFSNSAYAFVASAPVSFAFPFPSSLNSCAAKIDCLAAISSEVATPVAAPTGAGFGATTLTTTTATGATSTFTKAVAGVTAVGDIRLSGVVAYYIWNEAQNSKAQKKARDSYCAAYPKDIVCGTVVPPGQDYTFYWLTGEAVVEYCQYYEFRSNPYECKNVNFTYSIFDVNEVHQVLVHKELQ